MANKHTAFAYDVAKLRAAALAQGAAVEADMTRHWSLAAAWRRRARALFLEALS